MALLASTLVTEILKLTDKNAAGFVGFPVVLSGGVLDVTATNQLVAQNWAKACTRFFAPMTNPPVLPAVLSLATAAFQSAMFAALGPPGSPTGAAALDAGFVAFVGVVASGVAPFVATPPAGPPGIAAALGVPPIPTAEAAVPAGRIAARVFAWAITGTASIPPAPPLPWA